MAKIEKIKGTKIQESLSDKILNWIIGIILVLFGIIVAYPCIYVISCSFSSSAALEMGHVVLWPVDFTLKGYEFVLRYKQVWTGFRNSILYTISDVFIQMTMTICVAYPISRRYFGPRKFYTMLFYMSTRVSAGLIPSFILKCNLGLFDNVLAVIIAGSVGVGHILIMRTAINTSIPGDLFDAAMIDGANHFQAIFNIVIPLTKATMSVLTLYCIVGQWNEYATSMIYLRDARLYPLQLVLRPIMQAATAMGSFEVAEMDMAYQQQASKSMENVRYALIIISSAPVIIAYFVVQKHFKGGLMLGSVKG